VKNRTNDVNGVEGKMFQITSIVNQISNLIRGCSVVAHRRNGIE